MSESLVSQTLIGVSTAPEDTYNDNPVVAADFTAMVTRVREHPVTDSEKTDDRGVVGRLDSENPAFQRSGFRIPTAVEISDIVNTSTMPPLLRRFMGATAAAGTIEEALIAWKHFLYQSDPNSVGLQLPSTSMIYQNNEYDWLLKGGVGSTFALNQAGTADATFSLSLMFSGLADRISEIGSFGTLSVPPQDDYMYGTSSAIQYTDDAATTVSLTTPTHKWLSGSFSANNNLDASDTRAGMPEVEAGVPRRGWYRDFLHHGDREVSADFTMAMDSSFALKDAEEKNLVYTNYTWTMRGDLIPTTAEDTKHEVKLIIPKFHLRQPRTGEQNNKRNKGFTIFPVRHAGHYGLYRFEIIRGSETAIS